MHPQEKARENMQNKMMKKYFPVFVLPTLLAFTIGFIVPFIMGVYLSFCKFTTVTDAKFVGLQNYVKILLRMEPLDMHYGTPPHLRLYQ